MISVPPGSQHYRSQDRDHNDRQDYRFPNVLSVITYRFQLLPVVSLLTALSRKSIDQDHNDQHTDHHVRTETSLDTEACVVENAVPCRGCLELKDGILGHNSAVGQAEHNALREVPGCVCPDNGPKAVPEINDQREQHTDQEHLQQSQLRDTRISKMQGHKYQCVEQNSDDRPAVSSAQLLVQIASVNDLLRAGLDHHTEQEGEKEKRVEFIEVKMNIPLQP